MKRQMFVLAMVVCVPIVSVQAAFIVEPSGLASDHFTYPANVAPRFSSPGGTAPGITALTHAWGNSLTGVPDVYTFSYTPGVDSDNWDVPQYQYFGNGLYTTDLVGGQTGYYNVYITWPNTTNVSSLVDITVTHNGDNIVWSQIDQNDGGTNWIADQWDHDPLATLYGGNNKWLKIADQVLLTSGSTYTVTQVSQASTYVSMRSAGVMWEFVAIPEPATLGILGLGFLALRRRVCA
jgi:hypothetical protein